MIRVIETSTSERNQETQALFETIQPLLDKGYNYMTALIEIGKMEPHLRTHAYTTAWFKDLKAYGETQGYNYRDYAWKRSKK